MWLCEACVSCAATHDSCSDVLFVLVLQLDCEAVLLCDDREQLLLARRKLVGLLPHEFLQGLWGGGGEGGRTIVPNFSKPL